MPQRCENFEETSKVIEGYTPERVSRITGIPAEDLIKAGRVLGKARNMMILYAMGITQHTHGTDNVKSLANLAMLTGNIGRESTGVNPLRGQNNVQGACDLGGLPNVFTGYQPVTSLDAVAKFEKAWGAKLDDKPGLTATEMIPAAAEGRLKGMFILGENPMVSDPDLHHAEKGLQNLEFLVVQDIFMTETAALADVILPAACFAEKDGTFSNTERRVQRVRKAVEPPGSARADWEILTDLAKRMGLDWNYNSAEEIFREIASLTPSYAGISYDRLERESLQWPCPTDGHPGTRFLHQDQFSRGKGLFTPIEHQEPKELPDENYPLTLTTGRVIYQYHTRTMTGRSRGVDDLAPECLVEVHPEDAAKYGLQDGDLTRIASRRGEVKARITITEKVGQGVVFMPFHYAQASANTLTLAELDPVAKIPEYKVCAVSLGAA